MSNEPMTSIYSFYTFAGPANGSMRRPGAAPRRQPLEGPLVGKRVAIVEDEGVTQLQLRMILVKAGLQVVGAAGTGDDGVELVLRERPDLVLMDIKMPNGFNGLEAARRVLAEFRTCVVMITAYEEYQDEAEQVGTCGYVVKPVDSLTLIPQLEEAYERFWTQ